MTPLRCHPRIVVVVVVVVVDTNDKSIAGDQGCSGDWEMTARGAPAIFEGDRARSAREFPWVIDMNIYGSWLMIVRL